MTKTHKDKHADERRDRKMQTKSQVASGKVEEWSLRKKEENSRVKELMSDGGRKRGADEYIIEN